MDKVTLKLELGLRIPKTEMKIPDRRNGVSQALDQDGRAQFRNHGLVWLNSREWRHLRDNGEHLKDNGGGGGVGTKDPCGAVSNTYVQGGT